ncbi:UDP-N-acetylglucosamine--N-acetylmuramyl-(pentapeptide) pyrophosphoryl-undecaprenol N-acetylglucosamine transferase [Candidatus Roizmanbacteria bacterium]|nr:UDP-N-acetylglucosamine--N-acetylmuramyl-(pentapeptide) pyrophosphoryl-undecaprenol N-acetylglucosamine transferase [Candidatus Roizmanbacteria bacterium]
MKLLITGGHLTPALAVVDKIIDSPQKESISLTFVGRKYALDSEQTLSLEYKEITKRNIPFISLHAGRITRLLNFRSFINALKIPVGFIHAFLILTQQAPDVILSFGGYLAIPVAVVGWLLRIPVFTHEQTICPGLANRVIAFFSKKIFYSFPESKHFFPSRKSILTGNPVRSTVFKIIDKPIDLVASKPVIYVTGGSLGSHGINDHIRAILPELLQDYIVIHQTGDIKEYDDYEHLLRFRRSLPEEMKQRYFPVKHFFDNEIGYIYSVSDMVVARAGANTFFELIHLKKPTIFIPLPWSAQKEQQKHAEFFKTNKIGEIFEQKEQSSHLLELIRTVFSHKETYIKNFEALPYQIRRDATDAIIHEITQE